VTPLIIETGVLRQYLSRLPQSPQVTFSSRSKHIFVPQLKFWHEGWVPAWKREREIRSIEGDCEVITSCAVSCILRVGYRRAKEMGRDFTPGMFELRSTLNEPFLGCSPAKGDKDHCHALVLFTENGQDFTVAVYEPQAPDFLYETLDRIGDRISLLDVVL
jgi:hypothetical protein